MSGASYNLAQDLVDRHVLAGNGDRTALLFEDRAGFTGSWTYRDLAILSNRFARVLRGKGVTRGDRVLFRVPNHPAFYIGALGCAKLGAVFIPTSTLFKAEEVRTRLADSGAVCAVTTRALLPEVEAASGSCPELREILLVDDAGEPIERGERSLSACMARVSDHFVATATRAEDPAFLAYTSGTTAEPKGIVHLQRYARSYDYLIEDWHDYQFGDVVACPAEIGWMLPVASTFLYALRAGVTILLYREREPKFSASAWFELIERHRVTNFVGTPTIWRTLLASADDPRSRALALLRHGTSAGEPLAADTFEQLRARYGLEVLDGLGMSECMVYAHNRVGAVTPGACGRPGRGLILQVQDDAGREVAVGDEGVLCVDRASHPGMMLEYWNRPEATAAVFRERWYWSGDVVLRGEDGLLWFRGRADDVMKCSGYRISPFEIENCLQSHPAVLEAAAVEKADARTGAVVRGVVTLRAGVVASPDLEQQLIAHVKSRLAPFKAPKRIDFVEALPKTQSGKIQRRVLRA